LQSIAKTWGVNGPHPQPGFASLAPEKVNATITPDLLFEAHSSVHQSTVRYTTMAPDRFKGWERD